MSISPEFESELITEHLKFRPSSEIEYKISGNELTTRYTSPAEAIEYSPQNQPLSRTINNDIWYKVDSDSGFIPNEFQDPIFISRTELNLARKYLNKQPLSEEEYEQIKQEITGQLSQRP